MLHFMYLKYIIYYKNLTKKATGIHPGLFLLGLFIERFLKMSFLKPFLLIPFQNYQNVTFIDFFLRKKYQNVRVLLSLCKIFAINM